MVSLSELLIPAFVTYLGWRTFQYYSAHKSNPGFVSIFNPSFLLIKALPLRSSRRGNIRVQLLFHSRFEWFKEFKSSVIRITSLFPAIRTEHLIADPQTIALLLSPECDNISVAATTEIRKIFNGWKISNVLSSDGEVWKRHRRITSASFSKVICATAFGERADWNANVVPEGHSLTFPDALSGALDGLLVKFVTPKWLLKRIGKTQRCYDELEQYLIKMIGERRTDTRKEHHDLFSRLLYASDAEQNGAKKLSNEELLSNIFVFILAGHETSARNMGFTMIMMALWPEVQEKIFAEVSRALPADADEPTSYDEVMPKLPYTRASVKEALRLWPSATMVRRKIIAPVLVVPAHTFANDEKDPLQTDYELRQGDTVALMIASVHTNPYVWGADVLDYKPERFLDEEEKNERKIEKGAFIPFGGSSRICIGREFAVTEMIAFLAHTIRHYKVELPDHLVELAKLREGESQMDRMERILKTKVTVTLSHQKVALKFTRRERK